MLILLVRLVSTNSVIYSNISLQATIILTVQVYNSNLNIIKCLKKN